MCPLPFSELREYWQYPEKMSAGCLLKVTISDTPCVSLYMSVTLWWQPSSSLLFQDKKKTPTKLGSTVDLPMLKDTRKHAMHVLVARTYRPSPIWGFKLKHVLYPLHTLGWAYHVCIVKCHILNFKTRRSWNFAAWLVCLICLPDCFHLLGCYFQGCYFEDTVYMPCYDTLRPLLGIVQ